MRVRIRRFSGLRVLARPPHQGSRLSAVRWAQDHAVSEVLGLASFDEDDLYAALDDLCARQEKIERALYDQYQRRRGNQPPRLFLYDVTSSYLEGECNDVSLTVECQARRRWPSGRGRPQRFALRPLFPRCPYP